MKWLLIVIAAFATALFFSFQFRPPPSQNIKQVKLTTVSCNPNWELLAQRLNESDIPPMPGAGNYHWKINTANDSAQFYFNQGINMYYGFHIIESMASFKKATKLDSNNAMVYWAQALAYGPNINDVGYAASPLAYAAAQKAIALSTSASPFEQALINAMVKRYSLDTTVSREKLNQDYVEDLKKIHEQFSSNADGAALYADAMMLQHPWDLWNNDGTPKAWTPTIRAVLEKLLKLSPQHPGANHYYIHVMEASPYAALALPSANRLGSLTPGLSHMVHMPSHIYLRTGQYNKGSQVNTEAIASFKNYVSLFAPANENAFLYQWHNLHMQANCGLMAGRYQYSYQTAVELQNLVDTSLLSMAAPVGSYIQYLHMTPTLINVHFGKWNEILKSTQPASHHAYANVLYHFARGMAYAAQDKLQEAVNEKTQMETAMNNQSLSIPMSPFSPAVDAATVAAHLLDGFIELGRKNEKAAEIYFRNAVEVEMKLVYNEPRDWLLNARQYLGNFYLKMSKWSKAEKIFTDDMQSNNRNIWSVYGLQMALEKQRRKEAKAYSEVLKKLKQDKDVSDKPSLF